MLFCEKVCCGIVLYNPQIDLLEKNIDALCTQVDTIILINNHSDNIKEVYELIEKYDSNIEVIDNTVNHGIAKALNQILDYAENNGYEWYLTMDQDSVVSSNFIDAYSKYAEEENVGIISPFVLNNNKVTIDEYRKINLKQTENLTDPIECITSGALNRTKFARSINGYTDALFIDSVDVDFNIRMLEWGKQIIRINDAYLIQEMGKGKPIALLDLLYKITKINKFKRLSVSPVYSNLRLYYIFRNSKYLYDKYGKKAGRRMRDKWMLGQAAYYCLTYPIGRSRIKMIKTMIKGRKDSNLLGRIDI